MTKTIKAIPKTICVTGHLEMTMTTMVGAHLHKMTVASHLRATINPATPALSQRVTTAAMTTARTMAATMPEAGMEPVGAGPMLRAPTVAPGLAPAALALGALRLAVRWFSIAARTPQSEEQRPQTNYLAINSDEDVANTQQAKRRRGLSDKALTLGPPLEEPPGSAVVAFQSVGLAATDLELIEAQATEVLLRKHMRLRDDTMVKRLLETRKKETLVQKQGATEMGLLLAKKAEAEFAAAEERKRANLESK